MPPLHSHTSTHTHLLEFPVRVSIPHARAPAKTHRTHRIVTRLQTTQQIFAHPLPYNVIPHIDVFQTNGYTKEEMKVAWESQKILNMPDLPVSCTAVRIPTLRAHSEVRAPNLTRTATP